MTLTSVTYFNELTGYGRKYKPEYFSENPCNFAENHVYI